MICFLFFLSSKYPIRDQSTISMDVCGAQRLQRSLDLVSNAEQRRTQRRELRSCSKRYHLMRPKACLISSPIRESRINLYCIWFYRAERTVLKNGLAGHRRNSITQKQSTSNMCKVIPGPRSAEAGVSKPYGFSNTNRLQTASRLIMDRLLLLNDTSSVRLADDSLQHRNGQITTSGPG